MKNCLKIHLPVLLAMFLANFVFGQGEQAPIQIVRPADSFGQKPIPVSLEGFSGEVADVLRFDLYVQGFSFVAPDAAQYQISGSAGTSVTGSVTDKLAKKVLLSNSYTGTSPRRQAHAFANDIVFAITGKKGIGLTKIAFKAQSPSGAGEIYVSDFDGHDAQPVTHDNAIVSRPSWMPGRLALYYNSYKLENPDIFFSDLQPVGLAGRLEADDDLEQGRPAGCLCLQRRRLKCEAADDRHRGLVAVLVAGRTMDLLRDENQRPAAAGQGACGGRGGSGDSHRRRAESDRAGLVAGRQMDRVHVADQRV
jgi:hypothetical protein